MLEFLSQFEFLSQLILIFNCYRAVQPNDQINRTVIKFKHNIGHFSEYPPCDDLPLSDEEVKILLKSSCKRSILGILVPYPSIPRPKFIMFSSKGTFLSESKIL